MYDHIEQMLENKGVIMDSPFKDDEIVNDISDNNVKFEELQNKEIFKDLDAIIELSMLEQMKEEYLAQNELSEDEAADIIHKIENIQIEREDIRNFTNRYFRSVLEVGGFYRKDLGDQPFIVPLIMFEIACIVEDAKNGRLTDIYDIPENKDSIPTMEEGNIILAKTLLTNLFEEKRINDNELINAFINETINSLVVFGFNNIQPKISELVEFIYAYNIHAENSGLPFFNEILDDAKLGKFEPISNIISLFNDNEKEEITIDEETLNIVERYILCTETEIKDKNLLENLRKKMYEKQPNLLEINPSIYTTPFSRGKNPSLKTSGIVAGAALTIAAIASLASLAYKNKRTNICATIDNRANRYKCMANASDDAIRAIKAQQSSCKDHVSPSACMKNTNKLIAKWEKRKRRFLDKSVKIERNENKKIANIEKKK